MKKDIEYALAQFYGNSVKKIERPEGSDLLRVIDEFKQSSPDVPLESLYTAYRRLKEFIDSCGPEFSSHSNHFNDVFLRILEERGESSNGIYRSALRDSSEFRILNSILGVERSTEPEPVPAEETVPEEAVKEPVKLTLKQILAAENEGLINYPADEWTALVDQHFTGKGDEKPFRRECKKLVSSLLKCKDYEDYHLVIVVDYALKRLNSYKKVETKSKEYAMELLDLLSGRGAEWKRLHCDYMEIIKK